MDKSLRNRSSFFGLFGGAKDDGHAMRYERISEFRERIKKIIFVLDMA
jgi:hypothetical protein